MNKKAYMAPETVSLSLEPAGAMLNNTSKYGFYNPDGDSGSFGAPRRKTEVF